MQVHIFDNVSNLNLSKKQTAILFELVQGPKKMTELNKIIKNYPSLQKEIMTLESYGYVKREEKYERQRVVYVSLTEKGRAVAEKLKEAEQVSKLSDEELEKYKNLHALEHFNVYEDHVTITDISMEGVKYVNIYARPRGEVLYFYCEECGKDDCYHIGYLFFDTKLSKFIKDWINKNGYKLAKKYEKYVEKYW